MVRGRRGRGLASTDMLYFASGQLDLPGAMFTASHNPARYNGIKLCLAGAVPVGQDSGLGDIRDRAQAYLDTGGRPGPSTAPPARSESTCSPTTPGTCARSSTSPRIRPLRVVVDAGNGMGG